jgi:hypothetical protein
MSLRYLDEAEKRCGMDAILNMRKVLDVANANGSTRTVLGILMLVLNVLDLWDGEI